jgi:para-aminobenzoate synthetase component I
MKLREFTQTINNWAAAQIPFLFIIDFELQKPFACQLADAECEGIYFDVQGITNAPPGIRHSAVSLQRKPISFSEYEKKFRIVFDHLNYGDTFLTNLTIRTEIESNSSLADLFALAKAKYKLIFKNEFLVFSPETFVRISEHKIYAYPMKGTQDASIPGAGKILMESTKELAEHITIVDLVRNDLSQVANNVTVDRFRYLEEVKTNEKNLLQISSEISGQLPDDYRSTLGDILVSLLPAGSVSGAPKARTLDIIKEAENEERGYYTGIFGYFDGTNLDSGVMIRYIEREGDRLFYRSGGGITAQSTPQNEYQEAIDKIYVPVA